MAKKPSSPKSTNGASAKAKAADIAQLPDVPGALRSRIRELIQVRPSDLKPNPLNWRQHPQNQITALTSVLKTVGFVSPVIVRRLSDGSLELVDGHARSGTAELEGDHPIPAVVVDLNDEEMRVILTTYDPLTQMAVADKTALKDLIESITKTDTREMVDTIIASTDLHKIVAQASQAAEDSFVEFADVTSVLKGAVTCPKCGFSFEARASGGKR